VPDDKQIVTALRALAREGDLTGTGAALIASLPGGVEDGLRWQVRALQDSVAAGARLAGWKIGLTSRGSRDAMGAGVRPFGYVLSDGFIASGAELTAASLAGCRLEPELCLVIGDRLAGAALTSADARAAVRSVAPAFEIITAPLPGTPSAAAKVAARLNQRGIVTGAEAPVPADVRAAGVELRHDGEILGSATMAPEVIDDPFVSVARLSAALAPFGLALEPGQRVITGSLLAAVPAAAGRWEADFGPLGTVTAVIA
jgi:2-keto-4-pentenoate hydratase